MSPPDGDHASKTMLPILGPLPMAAEELDMEAYPILSPIFPSESGGLPAWQLSGLLRDIVNLYKKSKTLDDTAMSFPYGNGKNCNLVVVPETNSYANLLKLNREKQGIAEIMKQMSSKKSDRANCIISDKTNEETLPSVKWLCRHLATNYETDSLIAAKQAGISIIFMMDAATTSATAGDANLSKNQLWTINRYLTQSCRSRLLLPEQRLDKLTGVDRMVPAKHGTYLNQKKSQSGEAKPESVNY
jgi:hypothetical protein